MSEETRLKLTPLTKQKKKQGGIIKAVGPGREGGGNGTGNETAPINRHLVFFFQ